jgi:Tfp pilus assembly protein PilF
VRLQAALALWIACAVPSFAQDEFDSVLAAAEARFAKFDNRQAAELSKRAVALDPQLSFARFELAITYETLGDKRAEETFRAILRMNSQTSQDRRNRAIAEQKLRR